MVGLLEDPNPSNAASICCAMLCHLPFLYSIMCRVHEVQMQLVAERIYRIAWWNMGFCDRGPWVNQAEHAIISLGADSIRLCPWWTSLFPSKGDSVKLICKKPHFAKVPCVWEICWTRNAACAP